MKWLLEETFFNEDIDEIDRILRGFGDIVYRKKHLKYHLGPLCRDLFRVTVEPIMTIGSLELCKHINNFLTKPSCGTGSFCTLPNYDCTKYYPYYNKFLLNQDYCLLPVGDLVNSAYLMYSYFVPFDEYREDSGEVFIRPNSGDKVFDGQVVNLDLLKDFQASLVQQNNVFSDTLCLISGTSKINEEYRIFCTKDGPITGSLYKRQGKIEHSCEVPQSVYDYVSEVLKSVTFYPDRVFSMDIAVHYKMQVIELNSFSASGFYACDKVKLLTEVRKQTLEKFNENYASS